MFWPRDAQGRVTTAVLPRHEMAYNIISYIESLLINTPVLICWLFLGDAQMENEYASLVRGDQGKEFPENVPPILVPTKYQNQKVRKPPYAPTANAPADYFI